MYGKNVTYNIKYNQSIKNELCLTSKRQVWY